MKFCVIIFLLVLMMPLETAADDSSGYPFFDGSLSISDFSFSQSASISILDRIPCFFRGEVKQHGVVFKLDQCTGCRCNNGTMICVAESCEEDPRCQSADTIVEKGECCPHCPYSNPTRNCFFRGDYLPHKHKIHLDHCTVCTCKDHGRTHCHIEDCHSEPGCEISEIIFIPEKCCPQCPYKLVVKGVQISLDNEFTLEESSSNNVKFSLHVTVDKQMSSNTVRGEQLWRLKAWMSANKDGSGGRMSLQPNILNEEDAAKTFHKGNPENFKWSGLEYRIEPEEVPCGSYFCVKFKQGKDPRPMYNLPFTFQAHNDNKKNLLGCLAFPSCNG